ncbi:MAG TPA: hypothetical protein VLG40_02955 [Candidatus Saccharimonas sp.]|nr:hypothetical protein [Candidatus Saccharimonas sp.]
MRDYMSSTVKNIYISLTLQGLIFIGLAILIIVYPATLYALVAVTFVLIGVIMLSIAWKVYKLWEKLPDFLK